MRPLPEAVELRRLAAALQRFAEQVMATAGVVGHEVEQDAHPAGMRRVDQGLQGAFAAVARLDLEVILVVVAVVRRALMRWAEPQGVAAQSRDVVEALADAVESPSVERGRGAGLRQRCANARESVDHHLVDDRVVDPVRRAFRARLRELLASRSGVCVRGPDRGARRVDLDLVEAVVGALDRYGGWFEVGPDLHLAPRVAVRGDKAAVKRAAVQRALAPDLLGVSLVDEKEVLAPRDRRHERVDREQERRVRAKVDALRAREEPKVVAPLKR